MTQKLAKMVAIVTLALTPLVGSGAANAHGIGSGSARFHNSGWHGDGWHGDRWHGGFYRHYRRFSFGYYGHRLAT